MGGEDQVVIVLTANGKKLFFYGDDPGRAVFEFTL